MSPVQRRAQILAAARRMLESLPPWQITVEAVAVQAGVSPGLVFHYFGSQREFRRAVIESAAAELLARMRPDPSCLPIEQLRAALETFTAAVACSPGLYLAVVSSDSELSSVHWNVRAVLGDWLTAGLTDAGVPVTPLIAMTLAGWLAFAEEVITGWLQPGTGPGALTREDVVSLCERAFRRLLEEAVTGPDRWPGIERVLFGLP